MGEGAAATKPPSGCQGCITWCLGGAAAGESAPGLRLDDHGLYTAIVAEQSDSANGGAWTSEQSDWHVHGAGECDDEVKMGTGQDEGFGKLTAMALHEAPPRSAGGNGAGLMDSTRDRRIMQIWAAVAGAAWAAPKMSMSTATAGLAHSSDGRQKSAADLPTVARDAWAAGLAWAAGAQAACIALDFLICVGSLSCCVFVVAFGCPSSPCVAGLPLTSRARYGPPRPRLFRHSFPVFRPLRSQEVLCSRRLRFLCEWPRLVCSVPMVPEGKMVGL